MPCIRDDNGQPVPGAQGSCPIGSTFVANLEESMAWETGTSFTDRFLPALSGETKPGLGGTPADLLGGSFKAGGAALGLGLGSLKNSPQALKSLMSSLANKSKSVFNKGTQKFKDMKQFKGQYEPMIPSNVALNLKTLVFVSKK